MRLAHARATSDGPMLLAHDPTWPVLPLQGQLAPWLPMLLGIALAIAFVVVVVDTVERL